MGRALLQVLAEEGAQLVALTTAKQPEFDIDVEVVSWQVEEERSLQTIFQNTDILIINHGVNVYGDRTPEAVQKSLQVNALSALELIETFQNTLSSSASSTLTSSKEIWINTSEAEVSPALSPVYEVSKRLLGELITLKRLDSPCLIRKIVLGPFKSKLNPFGVMSAPWVAKMVIAQAKQGCRNIIVTVNPITYIAFPIKEATQSIYFQLFSSST